MSSLLRSCPEIYPGESLYSAFCRYHVRSCNHTENVTITQLFSRSTSMYTSILSPHVLRRGTQWIKAVPGSGAKSLIQNHTATPLHNACVPKFWCIQPESLDTPSSFEAYRPVFFHYIHQERYLRFCPDCAAEQRRLYGESYWQVTPHIDLVEYCPIHHKRILNSPIPLKSIAHHFYPADYVIHSMPGTESVPTSLDLTDESIKAYIQLANDVQLLLNKGEKIGTLPFHLLWSKLYNDNDTDTEIPRIMVHYFPSIPFPTSFWWLRMSSLQILLLIAYRYGGIKKWLKEIAD